MKIPGMALLVYCATMIVTAASLPYAYAEEEVAPSLSQPPAVASDSVGDPASGVLSNPGNLSSPILAVEPDYLIQEEDVLRMDVWGEPQLSNLQMQVTPDGKVNVPYIGEMVVKGLTQAQITKGIAEKFEEEEILIKPRVVITLLSMHRPTVRVLGAVQKSGEFFFKDGDRVLDAVAQAGYLDNSWLEKATLTRRDQDGQLVVKEVNLQDILNGNHSENIKLQKGDVLNIPPEEYQNKFFVMGQVMRPMMYDLKDNTTVLAALNLAGGPTERAAMSATMIIRGDPANPEKVKCDLAKMFEKADLSQNIVLQPGDVVYVPETKKPNWGKISQILSTISSFTYIRRYGLF